ncbi:MAG TPA: type II toxin-antitoxin system VapC family toxin [Clostridia bacterium]|nr:type II toxin-antitoxin system VapC family toxin [Clostridia bacterium]
MRKVLDAYAILCWMQGESGANHVEDILASAEKEEVEVYVSVINLGEVYYRLAKSRQREKASSFLMDVKRKTFPWKAAPITNTRVWVAAKLKAELPLSYADAFAVGLAQELSAELVTGDPEILAVQDKIGVSLDSVLAAR